MLALLTAAIAALRARPLDLFLDGGITEGLPGVLLLWRPDEDLEETVPTRCRGQEKADYAPCRPCICSRISLTHFCIPSTSVGSED